MRASRNASTVRRSETLADLRFLVRGVRRGLVLLSVLSLVVALTEAFLLSGVVQAVSALNRGDSEISLSLGFTTITSSVTLVLALASVSALVRWGASAWVAMLGPRITAETRQRQRDTLFESFLSASWSTQSADKSGRLLQAFSTSVNEASTVLLLATMALPAFITLIVLLVAAVALDPAAALFLMALGVVIILAMRPLAVRARRASDSDQALRDRTAQLVAGVLTAGAEISVAGSREGVLDISRHRVAAAERAFGTAMSYRRMISATASSVSLVVAAVGLWVISAVASDVDYTVLGVIALLLLRGAGLAQQVQAATSQLSLVAPFMRQVRVLTEQYEDEKQAFGDALFPDVADLRLHHASYTYPGTRRPAVVLDDVVFEEGTMSALVGPSGSGKSTAIQLLLRLRRPTEGEVLLGGVPVASIADSEFSDNVAYVPQSPCLVPGTIMENIRFFRPGVTEEMARAAAVVAHIHDAIEQQPDGYDTVIDTAVDALSGGQKQRVALARALSTSPRVLVLDEPTSALDPGTEAAVLDTLRSLRGRTTVIMVTHRASALPSCDHVVHLSPVALNADADHSQP